MLTAEQIAVIAAKALEDKKAKDVKVLKTREQTILADYFVICNGTSSTHIKALVDEVDKKLSEAGEPPTRREGLRVSVESLKRREMNVYQDTLEAYRWYSHCKEKENAKC